MWKKNDGMMKKAKTFNIVLTDFVPCGQWDFISVLNGMAGGGWKAECRRSNSLHGNRCANLYRIWLYFLFPLRIVFNRRKYGKIIGWQQFYALNFALWCRVFGLRKVNDLTVMTFIYKHKEGLAGKLYHRYIRYVVTSKYIDRFICFAKEECDYYAKLFGMDKNKFMFVPLGIKVANVSLGDDGTVFATGRSNRDYDFLLEVVQEGRYDTVIACDNYKKGHTTSNVKILDDCHGGEMLERMARCHCVAIPLADLNVSSGQLVVLQAMALGKPVVCTKSNGIKDYVVDGVSGFFVNNVHEEWLNALERLYSDKACYDEMSKCAIALYKRNFTETAMYGRVAEIINGQTNEEVD